LLIGYIIPRRSRKLRYIRLDDIGMEYLLSNSIFISADLLLDFL